VRPPTHALAVAALSPPAALYAAAMRARNRYYDRPGRSSRAGVPVVSVGNVTVGGTGKTPLVASIASELRRLGARPAVVSRGYGGRAGSGPVIVSRGEGPLCDWRECGDEPHLLARRLAGVVVVVGSDRVAGASAARQAGADAVVLDDGFQHRRLARDLDVVLVDGSNPFGNGKTLPAGILREPLEGLARADLLIVTRTPPSLRRPELESEIRRYRPEGPLLYAGHEASGFVGASDEPAPAPRRALAFCGIGNPDSFRGDLVARGVEVVGFDAFPDHHPYRDDELRALAAKARGLDASLVTTEKDLARCTLPGGAAHEVPLLALRIDAVVHDRGTLLDRLRAMLDEGPR
jgi:tetraacyldisaccharide 4'-kinase